MRTYYLILLFIILTSCNNKEKSTHSKVESNPTKTKINEQIFEGKKNILSTPQIDSIKILLLEEARKVMKIVEVDDSGSHEGYIIMPKYKNYDIAIKYVGVPWGDVFYLTVYKAGWIQDKLEITPHYKIPERNFYEKKKFDIYSDYTIKIDTEKKDGQNLEKYIKYYRINDQGKFYEVKEQ